jgi:hypothetical protein
MIIEKQVPPVSSRFREQPSPPSTPAGLPPDPQARRRLQTEQAQREAQGARDTLIAAALNAIIDQPDLFGPLAIQAYAKNFVVEAGAPADPVERVLVEQLLIAHHRVAQLQARAEKANNLDEIKIVNGAATRLLAEMRRLALAIRQYRAPIGSKSFSVIHQQNVAAGAQQHVNFVDQSSPSEEKVSFSSRTELLDKASSGEPDEPRHDDADEKPEARSRRQDQRLQTSGMDG